VYVYGYHVFWQYGFQFVFQQRGNSRFGDGIACQPEHGFIRASVGDLFTVGERPHKVLGCLVIPQQSRVAFWYD